MAKKKEENAAEDALALATQFRNASKAVGDFLYPNWSSVTPDDRVTLQGLEITLLNLATDLVTQAVDFLIENGASIVVDLGEATRTATDAIANINKAKKVITIATALIGLAASIPTGNLGGIKSAMELLVDTTNEMIKED